MGVRRTPLVALLALVLTACGAPSSVAEQAEDVASIAAEGALLAGDVAAGDSTSPFARVHAEALHKNADTLRQAVSDRELARVVDGVAAELADLAAAPGDRGRAAEVARRLDEAAGRAEEIGRAAP